MIGILILVFNFCLPARADQCMSELRFNLDRLHRGVNSPATWQDRRSQLEGAWFRPPSFQNLEIRYQLYPARNPSSQFIVQFLGLDSSLENTARDSEFLRASRNHVHVIGVELRGQGATWINEIVNNGFSGPPPTIDHQTQINIAKEFLHFVRTTGFWQANGQIKAPELLSVSTLSYSAWLGPSLMLSDDSLIGIGFDSLAPGAMSLDKLYAPYLTNAVDRSYRVLNSMSFGVAGLVRNISDRHIFETGLMKYPQFSDDRLLRLGASTLFFGIRSINALQQLPHISLESKIRLVIPTRDVIIPRKIYLRYMTALQDRPNSQVVLVKGAEHDLLTGLNPSQAHALVEVFHSNKHLAPFVTIERDASIHGEASIQEAQKNLIFEN